LFLAGETRAIPFVSKLPGQGAGHSAAYPVQAYSSDPLKIGQSGFEQVSHLQVGEGEQVHIPAGRVHSVATLGPRVCLSLYSTAAFGKGKEDKRKKKVVDNAADKEMADESTKKYQRLKRKYQKEKKQAEDAEDPQNPPKKHQKKEKKNRK
jgi:hypothetical protein